MNESPLFPLSQLLDPVSRPEPVSPEITYRILGAHWYAHGLYTKDTLTGGEIKASKVYRVKKGDFVYNRLFAWQGSFAVATEENDGCYVSNEFPCFQVRTDRLNAHYLKFYFSRRSAWIKALGLSSGGTPTSRNRLKEEAFLKLLIPLPPLTEQRRVVERIDALAAKIEEAKGYRRLVFAESAALMKATMRAVFTELPEDGASLYTVCNSIIDCLHSNPIYADDGIPTVRSPDVGWGRLFLDTARKTSEAEFQRRTVRGEPMSGDIVVVREGGGTGKAGMVEEGQRFSLGQRVMMLRPQRDRIIPKFLLYHWLSPLVFDDQIMGRMKGAASPHLNIGTTKEFKLRVPSLEQQRRVVVYLDHFRDRFERLEQQQSAVAEELDAMLPAILDQAFRGESL